MTDAVKIIEREIEARKAFPNEYDPDITRAMEDLVCPKADLVIAFDNYAKGFQDGYGEAIEKCEKAAQLFDGRAANAIRALAKTDDYGASK